MQTIKKSRFLFVAAVTTTLLAGCATGGGPQKGVNAAGEKVYLGSTNIQGTEAFKNYLNSPQGETDKQRYLFERLKAAKDLEFYHDGSWYAATEAFRGGMWLMRERYKKGQLTRDFIKKYVERSDEGNLHLAKYPDGSVQIGSYILYNELDLLESTAKKSS